MAGKISGASTRIKEMYPKALYVHCPSHRLNLCVAASCQLPMVEEMMSQFESIALFFYLSPVRSAVLDEVMKVVNPDAEHRIILNVCRTRWIARLDALDTFCELLPSVHATLDKIATNEKKEYSKKNKDTAKPLMKGIENFDFIAALVIVQKILAYTRGLTVKLQKVETDLVQTFHDVSLLLQTLKELRTNIDYQFETWYQTILELANEIDVQETLLN